MNTNRIQKFLTIAAAATPLLFAQPAFAGSWTLTSSMSGGYTAGASGSPSVSSTSNSFNYNYYGILSYTSTPLSGNFTYTGTIKWSGTDAAPATVTLSESGDVYGECAYTYGTDVTKANDGLGDAASTSYYTGYPGNAQTTTSQGSHSTVIAVPAGGSVTFTRTFSNYAYGPGLEECMVQYQASVQ
jgi:hypothetical protein